MEESFPRGGKSFDSKETDKSYPAAKKRKISSSKKTETASKRRSSRSDSPDPLAALWTGRLTPEICVPDLLVLGCVRTIMDQSVLLELPDGLQGILSLENISSVLTELLLQQHRGISNEATTDIQLQDYFTRGQLICCKIMPLKENAKLNKSKRRRTRLRLTINPEEVNSMVTFAGVMDGMVLNGAVRSVEEKGYLIDLGLGTFMPDAVGFLPYENCDNSGQSAEESKRYRLGQVILCAVIDAPSAESSLEKRVIRLSTLPVHLNGTSDMLERNTAKEHYTPGLVLKSTVVKILPSKGLIVQFAKAGGGCWRGFVSKSRLQHGAAQATDFKPNQQLKIAVLYTIPNSTVFGLSAESHLTGRASDEGSRLHLFDFAHVGDIADGRVKLATSRGVIFFELVTGPQRTPVFAKASRFQLEAPEDEEETMESLYPIGSKHRFRITGYSLIESLFYVDARKTIFKQPVVDVESCVPGTLVQATVWKVINDKGVCVRLYDRINGFVPIFHCCDTPSTLHTKRLDQKYEPGRTLKVRILHPDLEKNRIVLTMKKKLVTSPLRTVINSFDPSYVGEQADGFIVQINPERGLLVAFYGKARGWLPKAELEKRGFDANQKLSDAFALGETIRVQILELDADSEKMLLAPAEIKPTTVKEEEKENTSDVIRDVVKRQDSTNSVTKKCALAVGKIFTAIITKVHKLQLDVMIENQHPGRVFVTELSDELTQGSSPLTSYSPGQAVIVRVIGIRTKRRRTKTRKDSKQQRVKILGANERGGKKSFQFAECTMKASKLKAKSAKRRVLGYKDEFRKGERVAAVVEEFARKDGVGYSCHVAVNPNWKGVVPILQFSTDINVLKDPSSYYSFGHVIVGCVTGIQKLEKHLQLTCVPAKQGIVALSKTTRVLVTDADAGGKMEVKCRLVDGNDGFIHRKDVDESANVGTGQILEAVPVGKTVRGKWRLLMKDNNSKTSATSELTFESVVSKKPAVVKEELVNDAETAVSEAAQKMERAAGFSWNSGRFSMANLMELCLGDDDNESKGEQEPEKKKSRKGPKSKFERERLEEDELFQKEMELLNPDRQLGTADDFDRLIMGSPDSSVIWIRYMAFFLQRDDVVKARAVAERALKTISIREESERFNVWTALLNLENAQGTSESFRQVFDRAVAVNDPLKVYQLATKILRRANKTEECDRYYNEILAKFKSELVVWVSLGGYYMETSRADQARDLMKRAMRSLPTSKHVELVSRFAQMEYRYSTDTGKTRAVGDPERGRTLFENILRDYPKRTDVWSVYIDMTSKYQSMDDARPLFERVTSLKLNLHNMRLFYKKWLDLEERRGTPDTLQRVKKRAAEFAHDSLAQLPSSEPVVDDDMEHLDTAEME